MLTSTCVWQSLYETLFVSLSVCLSFYAHLFLLIAQLSHMFNNRHVLLIAQLSHIFNNRHVLLIAQLRECYQLYSYTRVQQRTLDKLQGTIKIWPCLTGHPVSNQCTIQYLIMVTVQQFVASMVYRWFYLVLAILLSMTLSIGPFISHR